MMDLVRAVNLEGRDDFLDVRDLADRLPLRAEQRRLVVLRLFQ